MDRLGMATYDARNLKITPDPGWEKRLSVQHPAL